MRGQFFVMAAIVLIFNLIVINQFIAKSAPPAPTEHFEELNYALTFEDNLRDVEASPPYLLKRNIGLFHLSSRKATSRGFSVSVECCKNNLCLPTCADFPMTNMTNMTLSFHLTSPTIELRSELPFR